MIAAMPKVYRAAMKMSKNRLSDCFCWPAPFSWPRLNHHAIVRQQPAVQTVFYAELVLYEYETSSLRQVSDQFPAILAGWLFARRNGQSARRYFSTNPPE
ncbi:MAG: hypothetical protein IPI44_22165 [Sulfuritalea sp.]|nr:hypothetical protein [Sulfuritalea sp.]